MVLNTNSVSTREEKSIHLDVRFRLKLHTSPGVWGEVVFPLSPVRKSAITKTPVWMTAPVQNHFFFS